MLVFTRSAQEEFVVGNDITVKVIGVRDGKVRIGVDAPKNVAIHRKEVFDRIVRETGRPAPMSLAK